jgi:hypothetical protein
MSYYEVNVGRIHQRIGEMQGKEGSIISDDRFQNILKKCSSAKIQFKTEHIEEARIQSCRAAIVYNAIKDGQKDDQNTPGYQETRDELNAISIASEKLSAMLQSASDQTLEVLCVADRIVDNEIMRDFKNISTSSFGHPVYRPISSDGDPGISFWTVHNIIKMIEVFSNMTRESKKWHRPTTKGGRPSNEATKMLISNLRRAWTLLSDNTFTFDQHESLPTTPAAAFCWEILQAVDPEAQFSSLATAMKKVVQYSGAKRGRPSSNSTKKSPKTLT